MAKLYGNSKTYGSLFLQIEKDTHLLDSFVFYNNEGRIFSCNCKHFENDLELNFDFKIKRKIKTNFKEKLAYIMKSDHNNGHYDLYIHEDLVGLKKPQYVLKNNTIYALYETDIENFNFEILAKCIDKNLDAVKLDIIKLSRKIDMYFKITSESLQETIDRLIVLKEDLKKEEDIVSKYTIEDYLKEINQ